MESAVFLVALFSSESADAKEQQCSLTEAALKERKGELQRVEAMIEVEREQQAMLIIHITQALDEQVCTAHADSAWLSELAHTTRQFDCISRYVFASAPNYQCDAHLLEVQPGAAARSVIARACNGHVRRIENLVRKPRPMACMW